MATTNGKSPESLPSSSSSLDHRASDNDGHVPWKNGVGQVQDGGALVMDESGGTQNGIVHETVAVIPKAEIHKISEKEETSSVALLPEESSKKVSSVVNDLTNSSSASTSDSRSNNADKPLPRYDQSCLQVTSTTTAAAEATSNKTSPSSKPVVVSSEATDIGKASVAFSGPVDLLSPRSQHDVISSNPTKTEDVKKKDEVDAKDADNAIAESSSKEDNILRRDLGDEVPLNGTVTLQDAKLDTKLPSKPIELSMETTTGSTSIQETVTTTEALKDSGFEESVTKSVDSSNQSLRGPSVVELSATISEDIIPDKVMAEKDTIKTAVDPKVESLSEAVVVTPAVIDVVKTTVDVAPVEEDTKCRVTEEVSVSSAQRETVMLTGQTELSTSSPVQQELISSKVEALSLHEEFTGKETTASDLDHVDHPLLVESMTVSSEEKPQGVVPSGETFSSTGLGLKQQISPGLIKEVHQLTKDDTTVTKTDKDRSVTECLVDKIETTIDEAASIKSAESVYDAEESAKVGTVQVSEKVESCHSASEEKDEERKIPDSFGGGVSREAIISFKEEYVPCSKSDIKTELSTIEYSEVAFGKFDLVRGGPAQPTMGSKDKDDTRTVSTVSEEGPKEKLVNVVEKEVAKDESVDVVEKEVAKDEPVDVVEKEVAKEESVDVMEKAKEESVDVVEKEVAKEESVDVVEKEVAKEESVDVVEKEVAKEESVDVVEKEVAKEESADVVEKEVAKEESVDVVEKEVVKEESVDVMDKEVAKEESVDVVEKEVAKVESDGVVEEKVPGEEIVSSEAEAGRVVSGTSSREPDEVAVVRAEPEGPDYQVELPIDENAPDNVNYNNKDGDHDSGVDESTQRKESPKKSQEIRESDRTNGVSQKSPEAAMSPSRKVAAAVSPSVGSPAKAAKTSASKASSGTQAVSEKKVPMNKVVVGTTASPNIKVVRSKIGSMDNIKHKPGGGEIKVETKKISLTAVKSKIGSIDNIQHKALGGDKKVITRKLEWKAESKVGSLDNASHKPGGGTKKIETQKLEFKEKAKPKVGSKDNIQHKPGGGEIQIEEHKTNFKETAKPKVGSMDNVTHKPGGGTVQIFDEKTYYKQQAQHQMSSSKKSSLTGSDGHLSDGQSHSPQPSPNTASAALLSSESITAQKDQSVSSNGVIGEGASVAQSSGQ